MSEAELSLALVCRRRTGGREKERRPHGQIKDAESVKFLRERGLVGRGGWIATTTTENEYAW